MGARSRATQSHETLALVLRRTPYGEADLVVSLFTKSMGRVSALARAARKSQRRFGGSLEPFNTLEARLEEASTGADLLKLTEARVVTARVHLLEHLPSMEAAGNFLNWIRHAAPEHTPEPTLWELCQSCLDELDAAARDRVRTSPVASAVRPASAPPPSSTLSLASHGLRLLVACGWRLELERCVQSGVRCPEGKAAMVDPERGGLVSQARGGAPFSVTGPARRRLIAAQAGASNALTEADAELGLQLVERTLRAHAGLVR